MSSLRFWGALFVLLWWIVACLAAWGQPVTMMRPFPYWLPPLAILYLIGWSRCVDIVFGSRRQGRYHDA